MYTVWLDPINRLDPTGAERLGQRRVIENAQVALEPNTVYAFAHTVDRVRPLQRRLCRERIKDRVRVHGRSTSP